MNLADTSAWGVSRRGDQPLLRSHFDDALTGGEIATCDMVRLELLKTARNGSEFREIESWLAELTDCPLAKPEWERALWVYGHLAEKGGARHRAVGHGDLLIAAAAESAGLTLLHYDQDFERIAAITKQPTRWVAPKGSI